MDTQRDEFGRTSLHYAANDGDGKTVRQLIARGADVNATDNKGWTPLHFGAQANSEEVVCLLLQAGASVEARDSYGNTPLWRAVFSSRGDGDVIQALRRAGSNADAENKSGVSPRSLAQSIANYDVKQYFTGVT